MAAIRNGAQPRSFPSAFSAGQALRVGTCTRDSRHSHINTREVVTKSAADVWRTCPRRLLLALTWRRCEALCRCRHVTPDGARRLWGSARLSARVEFAGLLGRSGVRAANGWARPERHTAANAIAAPSGTGTGIRDAVTSTRAIQRRGVCPTEAAAGRRLKVRVPCVFASPRRDRYQLRQ